MNTLPVVAHYLSVALLCVSAYFPMVQSDHFVSPQISFDYLKGWKVSDKSDEKTLRLLVESNNDLARITIVVPKEVVRRTKIDEARQKFNEALINEVASKIDPSGKSLERVAVKSEIAGETVEGIRLRDTSHSGNAVAEVYGFYSHLTWINLVFGSEVDMLSRNVEIWKSVTSSLEVNTPVIGTKAASRNDSVEPETGILNGRALALPPPSYPNLARAAHASGKVVVQVVIDEHGNVISAAAVSGHPLLQATCVAAAKQARFSPVTFDDEPVKVTGVIEYNFVPQ